MLYHVCDDLGTLYNGCGTPLYPREQSCLLSSLYLPHPTQGHMSGNLWPRAQPFPVLSQLSNRAYQWEPRPVLQYSCSPKSTAIFSNPRVGKTIQEKKRTTPGYLNHRSELRNPIVVSLRSTITLSPGVILTYLVHSDLWSHGDKEQSAVKPSLSIHWEPYNLCTLSPLF